MQQPRSPSPARVGVFDSGVGGLTVAAAIHRLMPSLPVHYLADTAYFPYGERSEDEVSARALALAAALVAEGCNLLVVACNTASSAALEALRARFDMPIVGMEPPLKPAAERTRSGRVVILATPATARGERLRRLRSAYGNGARIEILPMPGLADLVEQGEIEGERVRSMLAAALAAPLADGADEIALGCTHYGYLRPLLEGVAPGVEVVDAAEAVARRVRQQLAAHGLDVPAGEEAAIRCRATGDAAAFAATIERLRAGGADLPPLTLDATAEAK